MTPISIDGLNIGVDYQPYVIAELSGNHNGDLNRALDLMVAAKEAGAHAVKLQTYTPDTMTIDCDAPIFRIHGGLWDGRSLYELYGEAQTPWPWHEALFAKGREIGITVFSTPFDETAVDFLEDLGAPAYKIASFEIIDLPLIRRVAQTGKPMIVSTGMANLGEIREAVDAARSAGSGEIVLLHCVSAYPATAEQSNIRTIPHLASTFDAVAGLSDHTLGVSTSVAAIALGAAVIEKHFTLRRADGGPDAAFSLEPPELARLVNETATAWASLGRIGYDLKSSEEQSLTFRRSLIVIRDIGKGAELTKKNVRSIRPGQGLPPKLLPKILGRKASRDLPRGTPLDWTMIS